MLANATATLGQLQIQQVIETANAIYLAGQTVTFSAYIYGSSSTSIGIGIQYNTSVDATWNGGGWSSISATSGGTVTATTSWSKITGTYTIPSNAKTVLVQIYNNATVSSSAAIYFTGLQLELGSVATPFSRAGGTVQGELALCQRYYWRGISGASYGFLNGAGFSYTSSNAQISVTYPVTMRAIPSSVDYSSLVVQDSAAGIFSLSSITLDATVTNTIGASFAGTTSGMTTNRFLRLLGSGSTAYIGFSAEL